MLGRDLQEADTEMELDVQEVHRGRMAEKDRGVGKAALGKERLLAK